MSLRTLSGARVAVIVTLWLVAATMIPFLAVLVSVGRAMARPGASGGLAIIGVGVSPAYVVAVVLPAVAFIGIWLAARHTSPAPRE